MRSLRRCRRWRVCIVFFFFQAEDGIRDHCVTGVQTCALPIFVAKARAGVGAVAAIPISDTVKDVEQERITKTVARDRLWRAQTPQGVPRTMIEQAYAGLANGDAAPTGDAELCERGARPVEGGRGSPSNLE